MITVILLYILILVGGFVRITESGDDCPDWPKCYGSWVPPLSIDDIPDDQGGRVNITFSPSILSAICPPNQPAIITNNNEVREPIKSE